MTFDQSINASAYRAATLALYGEKARGENTCISAVLRCMKLDLSTLICASDEYNYVEVVVVMMMMAEASSYRGCGGGELHGDKCAYQ